MEKAKTAQVPVSVRIMKPSDRNYILATMSKGLLDGAPFRWMERDVWRKHHSLLEALLKRASVYLAVNPDDEDHIYGYVVFERQEDDSIALHYLYVKELCRGRGIARHLMFCAHPGLGTIPVRYTHPVKFMGFSRRRRWRAVYDPYLLSGVCPG